MRRSIQGVGHMMSTMVLSRKQSVFGASSLPTGVGVPEQLDRSKFEDNNKNTRLFRLNKVRPSGNLREATFMKSRQHGCMNKS